MGYSLGQEGQLYVAGSLCNAVSSVKIPTKRNTGKIQSRGSDTDLYLFGTKDLSVDVEAAWNSTDTGLLALKAAFESGNPIALRAIDGTSGSGAEGDFGIESRDFDQPMNEGQKVTFKALPHAKGAGVRTV